MSVMQLTAQREMKCIFENAIIVENDFVMVTYSLRHMIVRILIKTRLKANGNRSKLLGLEQDLKSKIKIKSII